MKDWWHGGASCHIEKARMGVKVWMYQAPGAHVAVGGESQKHDRPEVESRSLPVRSVVIVVIEMSKYERLCKRTALWHHRRSQVSTVTREHVAQGAAPGLARSVSQLYHY